MSPHRSTPRTCPPGNTIPATPALAHGNETVLGPDDVVGWIPENVTLAAPGVVSIQLVASVQVQNRPANTEYSFSTATRA